MKKTFTLFLALCTTIGLMAAPCAVAATTSAEFEFTNQASVEQEEDGLSVTLATGTGTSDPTIYSNGMRLYKGNTITVSAKKVTKVELSFSKQGSKSYATLSANEGSLTSGGSPTGTADVKTDVWTGDIEEVVFTLGAGQRVIKSIVVYGEGDMATDTITIDMKAKVTVDEGDVWGYYYYVDATVEASNDSVQFAASISAMEESEISFYDTKWKGDDIVECSFVLKGDTLDCSKLTLEASRDEDTTWVVAKARIDTILYWLNLKYTIPEAKDTVKWSFEDAELSDQTGEYGYFGVGAQDEKTFAQFEVVADEIEGEYTLDDVYTDYTYVGYFGEKDTTFISFLKLNITVEMVDDSTADVLLQGLGEDTLFYIIKMTALVTPENPYEYDEASDVTKEYDATKDAVEWDTDYFEEYNYVGLTVTAEDESDMFMIGFYSETEKVANGTYTIDDSGEIPSAEASTGYDGEYIYPAFYGTTDEEGYIESVWFIVGGSVTVSDQSIVVNGLNSLGNSVKVTVKLNSSGLDKVTSTSTAAKRLVNGQLLINRNGVQYNAQGQQVK